jgi:hypothetical protein
MHRQRLLLVLAAVAAVTSAPALARAQSIESSTPERISSQGMDLGQTTRTEGQNPLGISYADCAADLTLRFSVQLTGFSGQSLQVWASLGSPCVDPQDRGLESGNAVCWALEPSMVPTQSPTTVNVRVQDLVGWQSTSPLPTGVPAPTKGSEACTAQPGYALVPMAINFLVVDGSGNPVGVSYQYTIQTDMVGPPAPVVCETVGDTIYNLTWAPNSDSDTVGYGIYIDPIPGQEPDAGRGGDAGTIVVCPGGDAGDAGDAGCSTLPIGVMPPDGGSCGSSVSDVTCNDPNLMGSILPTPSDDGGSVTPMTSDDGGDGGVEGGVEEGSGGISTVSTVFLYKPSTDASNMTVVDKSTSSYQFSGLVDYVTYTVVVSAVDGMGNVGPPSAEVCDYPAPVQDFWQVYEADGGGRGGYCALGVGGPSLAGLAGILVVVGVVRRRRRRR